MKLLVANLGSTSFKYRLFDLSDERQLARGGIDRIGESQSACFVEIGGRRSDATREIPDHAAAVGICLEQLTDADTGCLQSVDEVAAIGFKAVFAGNLSGVRVGYVRSRVPDDERKELQALKKLNATLIPISLPSTPETIPETVRNSP